MKTMHKNFHRSVIGLLSMLSSSAFAWDRAGVEFASRSVAASKAVEVQAVATKLVLGASAADQEQVAVAVVTSAIRSHSGAFPAVISSVAKAAPSTTSAIVKAALDVAPGSSLAIVSAAAKGAPSEAGKTVAIASRGQPSLTAAFEREVAAMNGNGLLLRAEKDKDSGVGRPDHPPKPPHANSYAHPGDGNHGKDDEDHGNGKDGDHGKDAEDHGRSPTFPKKP